jgi:hypothetical protein
VGLLPNPRNAKAMNSPRNSQPHFRKWLRHTPILIALSEFICSPSM